MPKSTAMKGLKLLVLLSSLWGGVLGLTNTPRSRTAPEEENSPLTLNSTSAPQNEVLSLQVLSATHNPPSKAAAAPERPSEDILLQSTLQNSETRASAEGRSQTPTPLEKTGAMMAPLPLALQSKPIMKPGTGAGMVELANATLNFLQSFSRKPNQQAISPKSAGDMGNRSPRETHLSRSGSIRSQRPSYQKSSFETTRGK